MSIDEEMRRISLAANIECNRQMPQGAGMSEVFDPEKVNRMPCSIASCRDHCIEVIPSVVAAADYDKLLALYREARTQE